MAAARNFTISCHCGAARQAVAPRGNQSLFSEVSFCHCDSCRHLTGLLCASYAPISSHPAPSVAGLQSYSTSPASTRYFCSTCGCHVFRASRPSPSSAPEQWSWEVATGAVVDGPAPTSSLPEQWRHLHIRDTKDGGLSAWLPNADPPPQSSEHSPASPDQSTTLPASCHCRSISLQITRPSPDPALNPDSPYADLLLPYHSTPSTTVSNPSREKWYLRPDPALLRSHHSPSPNHQPQHVRYLAGTCACETCRLTSGFEIQTWSFIPRRNILIRLSQPGAAGSSTNPAANANASSQPDPQHQGPQQQEQEQGQQKDEEQQQQQQEKEQHQQHHHQHHHQHHQHNQQQPEAEEEDAEEGYRPLDFTRLPATTALRAYESSPGRLREFCGRCGATVFWHDRVRPDLIDVSAGLFRAAAGARAEDWLAWWTGRVSFSEEAGTGRHGGAKAWGKGVIKALERRLKAHHQGQSESQVRVSRGSDGA